MVNSRESRMAERNHKWSFCRNCLKNVPHYREIRMPVLRILDVLSLRCLSWFRIGPWFCVHCERRTSFLKGERYDAAHSDSAAPDPEWEAADDTLDPSHAAHPVGNFIKEEESLVIRSKRMKRFSEKYRDSVVRRIMSGKTSMAQVRQEKKLSEGELIDWIADLFDRMQSKLDGNVDPLGAQRALEFQAPPPDLFQSDSIPDGPTIEGKVKPK
jgi:hypothetical protein